MDLQPASDGVVLLRVVAERHQLILRPRDVHPQQRLDGFLRVQEGLLCLLSPLELDALPRGHLLQDSEDLPVVLDAVAELLEAAEVAPELRGGLGQWGALQCRGHVFCGCPLSFLPLPAEEDAFPWRDDDFTWFYRQTIELCLLKNLLQVVPELDHGVAHGKQAVGLPDGLALPTHGAEYPAELLVGVLACPLEPLGLASVAHDALEGVEDPQPLHVLSGHPGLVVVVAQVDVGEEPLLRQGLLRLLDARACCGRLLHVLVEVAEVTHHPELILVRLRDQHTRR